MHRKHLLFSFVHSVPLCGYTMIYLTSALQVDILVASSIFLLKTCCITFSCDFAPMPDNLCCPCFIDGADEAQGNELTSLRSQITLKANSTTQPQGGFPSTTAWSLAFRAAAVSCCHSQPLPRGQLCKGSAGPYVTPPWGQDELRSKILGWGGLSLRRGKTRPFSQGAE